MSERGMKEEKTSVLLPNTYETQTKPLLSTYETQTKN